jgi:hypothetical protein
MTAATMVTEEDYEQAARDLIGWCPNCRRFTRDGTEGDATGYDCPSCDYHNVVGAEEALVTGLIDFKDAS